MQLDPRTRRLASRLIDGMGLRRPVFRMKEWLMSRGDREIEAADGAPVPSPYLRTLVGGSPGLESFLQSGRLIAEEFDAILRDHGSGLFEAQAVLEWGCGCGRLSRWIAPRTAVFTGVDINARLLRWCAAHLPGRYLRNTLQPPLPVSPEFADVVYACSVLTHLREETSRAWLAEIARVLRADGRALITFHDPEHPSAAPVRAALERDGWAVRFDRLEGSNNLAACMTIAHLEQLASPGLRLLTYRPSSRSVSGQGVALFSRAR